MSQNFSSPKSDEDQISIRSANPNEAGLIVQLLGQVYAPFEADFTPTASRWTVENVSDGVANWLLAFGGVSCDLARTDASNQLLGAVRHESDPLGYTFDALAVRPDKQGKGIGSRLVHECEALAMRHGRPRMVIALRMSLQSNLAFFMKRGYSDLRAFGNDHRLYGKEL
ncbi:GNAT family N-acetyltransferase [Arthrobacter sp. NPDC090010]|uniref:GNAT family N-acetyltransferase n=1 Tax=Arthrobacter sp. NPDC090010 TaxID=3363942 RepID=UPI0038030A33